MPDIIPLSVAGTPYSDPSDQELMERIATGDARALEQLLERYWHGLVRYGTAILRDVDAAEDVVQDTFVRVWERGSDWRPGGSVRSFLYGITRNLALNERRRRRVRLGWLERMRGHERPESPPPSRVLEVDDCQRAVEHAIDQLPERRREVFILAWFHQLSHRQIAEVLGISPNTVSNQVSAANAELRRRLAGWWHERS